MLTKFRFSLVTSVLLLLSSFIPVMQVMILSVNGGFISLLTSNSKIMALINGIGSFLGYLFFYISNVMFSKLLSLLAILFFFIPFLFYSMENLINVNEYYFLHFFLIGAIAGMLLFLVEVIKKSTANKS